MKVLRWYKKNFLLATILIVAAFLRFIAVNPGYNPYHGDETAIWGSALEMVKKSTLDPGRYDYPATAIVINSLLYKYFFIPVSWVWYYLTHSLDVIDGLLQVPPSTEEAKRIFTLYIAGERGVNTIFWARYVTALFGVGTVFLTYILSKKMFSRKVGLLAALFLTVNYRNVVNSHLALPDIYNSFFLLLSLIASWNLLQKPSRRTYLLAGIACGLAFSAKYQIFSLFPLIFVHLYLVFKEKFSVKKLLDLRFVAACLCVPLVFLLTNPYFFIHLETVLVKMNEEFRKYGMGTNTLNFFPLSYLYHIDYGPIEFVLVVLGLFIGLARNTLRSLFLLSVIVPFLYIFLYYSTGGFYVRNFITITPLLLIFASVVTWQIAGPVIRKLGATARLLLMVTVFALILYVPASNSIISSYGYTKPWGYDTLRPWIQENVPKNVIVGAHPFDRANLALKNKTTEFAPGGAYSLAEHMENNASYVIVNLNWANLPFYSWMSYGFDELPQLWNKPLNILRNTYFGIAAEELFRYQIHTVSKPWQSPDTHFIVAKVPQWPTVETHTLKQFSFDKDEEGWEVFGVKREKDERFKFDSEVGKKQPGSLVSLHLNERFPIGRMTSGRIPVKAKHLYSVKGFLRTDRKLESKERDGFIRLDFYSGDVNLEKLGIRTDVSSRVYGTSDWVEKRIVDVAPDAAEYMTVSASIGAGKIWLDDVVIEESKEEVNDPTSDSPYTKDAIDPNYLYPNSHGNL